MWVSGIAIDAINLVEQHSSFIQTMVSIFMAIIVLYFNYRTLKLNEKDRERPRVVELVQFVIVPVKAWLPDIGRYYLEEFNLKKNLSRWIGRSRRFIATSGYRPPSPEVLCANFYALLEKLSRKSGKLLSLRRRRRNWKSEWDEKVQRFNDVQRKLSPKMEELSQRLEKFISESLDIEKIYEETGVVNYYSLDVFIYELTDPYDFYHDYKQAKLYDAKGKKWSLKGAWLYAGNEAFYSFVHANEAFLAEIDKLMEELERARDSLVAMLEEIRKWLEKEYKLTPSEQISAIMVF
ncbi:MAG: hypothetical protein LM573_05315 [Thermofilum sp.]|nr:hypothetical protein [Thermofilum sp.]